MLDCLKLLGVSILETVERSVSIRSDGRLRPTEKVLFVGNAGTTARFLTAAATTIDGKVRIDGNDYMRQRPIAPLLEAIARLGVGHKSVNDKMPLELDGNQSLHQKWADEGVRPLVSVDATTSSQYVSALLIIAPTLPCGLEVRIAGAAQIDAQGYIDVTLDVMSAFGVEPSFVSEGRWVFDHAHYIPCTFDVEPDYSACTYFWAARQLGCVGLEILGEDAERSSQPDARAQTLIATFPNLPTIIDGSQIQDSIPALAVLAAYNAHPVQFSGIQNLRVKECDRIEAISCGLNKIAPNLAIVEGDNLIVNGPVFSDSAERPVCIDSFDDHRIAMAFWLFALKRAGVSITNPRCVAKTFPEFWTELQKVGITGAVHT